MAPVLMHSALPEKLRVAVLGDSWVSTWTDQWTLESALPEGLRAGLNTNSRDVELVIAGFPGYTADRLLALAKLCSLEDLANLDGGAKLPWYGDDLNSLLRDAGVSASPRAEAVKEDVDVVVLVAGYNDLCHDEADAEKVYRILDELRSLYISRGVHAILVTLGQGRSQYEDRRKLVNSWLLSHLPAVDCDALVEKLEDDAWYNMEHLTAEGSRRLGRMLAEAITTPASCKEGKHKCSLKEHGGRRWQCSNEGTWSYQRGQRKCNKRRIDTKRMPYPGGKRQQIA